MNTLDDQNSELNINNVNCSSFFNIINKLPHSKCRVPYTYHHDYLREHVKRFNGVSRSHVASNHNSNDTELYAIALIQLLNEIGNDAMYLLTSEDIVLCKLAIKITDDAIIRYDQN